MRKILLLWYIPQDQSVPKVYLSTDLFRPFQSVFPVLSIRWHYGNMAWRWHQRWWRKSHLPVVESFPRAMFVRDLPEPSLLSHPVEGMHCVSSTYCHAPVQGADWQTASLNPFLLGRELHFTASGVENMVYFWPHSRVEIKCLLLISDAVTFLFELPCFMQCTEYT